ncbi:sporulation protein YunB [Priestia flexa]|uniref:Sporulation protein YunB n=1 Tax=Priestia flexa TaxID=86664 RepID=A0A8I1SPE5_9BACI|nr:sporulation protein YunB [Priestia flexa]AQX53318.1 sporulation protein YunB [Priestia flexa]MBN8253085.1 sporulation protein YunB [Priestia flexa]MBN8433724.1 sporulation protein YunB [Priestia flexa]MCA0966018.1 sporulation protein YunB [Priestia flexa]RIV05989.1 sporulation protein YunB [Priestia flexa]
MIRVRRRVLKKGPIPFRYVVLLTIVFFLLSTGAGIWLINRGIEPTLMKYAEAQTKEIATLVINKAVNKQVVDQLDVNDIIKTESTPDGQVAKIDTAVVNRIRAQTTSLVQANLREAEKGNLEELEIPTDINIEPDEKLRQRGIVYQVPLGQATNNALLGNLGPLIPVKFHAIGDVQSDVVRKIEEYGINGAFLEISIEVQVNVQVIIPFATKQTTVQATVPVGMAMIPGSVPDYFNGGTNSASPSIELKKK